MSGWLIFALIIAIIAVVTLVFHSDENEGTSERVWIPSRLEADETIRIDSHGVHTEKVAIPVQADCKIPRRIMQTYMSCNLPINMAKAIASFVQKNPGYVYEFFDDESCTNYVEEHFDQRTSDAYNMLIPGAFKCDVFRVCYLIREGGWYADASMVAVSSFDSIPVHDLVLVRDSVSNDSFIYQALIGAVPGNKILKYVLEGILTRVHSRVIPQRNLAITGPEAFGQELNRYLGRHIAKAFEPGHHDEFYMLDHRIGHVWDGDNIIVNRKYNNWMADRPKKSHYSMMFSSGKVFMNASLPTFTGFNGKPVIWQTWDSRFLSDHLLERMHHWAWSNGDFQYVFMDRHERAQMMDGSDYAVEYKSLKCARNRQDLWRLYCLYTYGGLYADVDVTCKSNVFPVYKALAPNEVFENEGRVQIQMCKPGSEELKRRLVKMASSIRSKVSDAPGRMASDESGGFPYSSKQRLMSYHGKVLAGLPGKHETTYNGLERDGESLAGLGHLYK